MKEPMGTAVMYGMHLGNARNTEREPKRRRILTRVRRFASDFVRNHIVADEKDLWPGLTPQELYEQETDMVRRDAASR